MKVRYDDFWILTCLRRRIELPFAAPLPLGETFGLAGGGQKRPKWPQLHCRGCSGIAGEGPVGRV
jgi:hypothetical protein